MDPKINMPTHKIHPVLWFHTEEAASAAAKLYTTLFPSENTHIAHSEPPVTSLVLAGQEISFLVGGPMYTLTPALSLFTICEDQAEVDKLWAALGSGDGVPGIEGSGGGQELECGWVTDRFGVSWQIVPRALLEMLNDEDPGRRERAQKGMLSSKKFEIERLRRVFEGEEEV
jgi:predicted 3-demethylubiquinone-9 3-methyltransferase (glyoxalase superfamily)